MRKAYRNRHFVGCDTADEFACAASRYETSDEGRAADMLCRQVFLKNRSLYGKNDRQSAEIPCEVWRRRNFAVSILAGKVLADYQVKRLIIFLAPESDRYGYGWNIRNSKIAIGSGGLFGQGYMQGPQSHLDYLPEKSTDFIFSILSEEWGFIGCVIVFILYFTIFLRCIKIMNNTTNTYGYYITTGIFTMLLHIFC